MYSRNLNKLNNIGPNSLNATFPLSHQRASTGWYPHYLCRWSSYGYFPQHIFIFLIEKKLILLIAYLLLNIRAHTKWYCPYYWIVMILLQKSYQFREELMEIESVTLFKIIVVIFYLFIINLDFNRRRFFYLTDLR